MSQINKCLLRSGTQHEHWNTKLCNENIAPETPVKKQLIKKTIKCHNLDKSPKLRQNP